jgi:hypothetical protein
MAGTWASGGAAFLLTIAQATGQTATQARVTGVAVGGARAMAALRAPVGIGGAIFADTAPLRAPLRLAARATLGHVVAGRLRSPVGQSGLARRGPVTATTLLARSLGWGQCLGGALAWIPDQVADPLSGLASGTPLAQRTRLSAGALAGGYALSRLLAPVGIHSLARFPPRLLTTQLTASPLLLGAAELGRGATLATLSLHLGHFAATEYTHYDFLCLGQAGEAPIGIRPDGIYLLQGETDAGVPIQAEILTGSSALGTNYLKRVTKVSGVLTAAGPGCGPGCGPCGGPGCAPCGGLDIGPGIGCGPGAGTGTGAALGGGGTALPALLVQGDGHLRVVDLNRQGAFKPGRGGRHNLLAFGARNRAGGPLFVQGLEIDIEITGQRAPI